MAKPHEEHKPAAPPRPPEAPPGAPPPPDDRNAPAPEQPAEQATGPLTPTHSAATAGAVRDHLRKIQRSAEGHAPPEAALDACLDLLKLAHEQAMAGGAHAKVVKGEHGINKNLVNRCKHLCDCCDDTVPTPDQAAGTITIPWSDILNLAVMLLTQFLQRRVPTP